jgi:hypothetical protein
MVGENHALPELKPLQIKQSDIRKPA